MKKLLCQLSIFIALCLTFSSCNKYPEGPKLSLLSKKARLSGDWKMEKILINNVDQTAAFTSNEVFSIKKDGKYSVSSTPVEEGTWKFSGDKKQLIVKSNASGAKEITYTILKLKNKELWLKIHDDTFNADIETHYKQ